MSQENKNHILQHMGEKAENLNEHLVKIKIVRETNDETKSAISSHKADDDDDFV